MLRNSFHFALPSSCPRGRRNQQSATQNNGQISQSIDSVSAETIDYTYDSLNRLITSATQGPQWGLSFSYDGFGNRLSQTVTKGSGPSNNLSVNAATNRITSTYYGYDSNGNLIQMPYGTGWMTLSYDIENRLIQAVNTNGTERYAYGPDNRRMYQKTASGTELVFFYGINGDRLRTYQLQGINGFLVTKTNIYFDGRLILGDIGAIHLDRLGSVRNTSRYYPFGEEQGSGTIPDKFATYYRDTSTGLDYAMNRYYSSSMGRFTTPDPYGGSAKRGDPQSWNRYAYVNNDPVNKNDPSGLLMSPYGPGDEGGDQGSVFCSNFFGYISCGPFDGNPDYTPDPGPSGGSGVTANDRLLRDAMADALDRLKNVKGCWEKIFPGLAKEGVTPEQFLKDHRITTAWGSIATPAQAKGSGAVTKHRNRYQNYDTYAGVTITYNLGPGTTFANYRYHSDEYNGITLSQTDSAAIAVIHEYGHAAALLEGPSASSIHSDSKSSSQIPGLPTFTSWDNSDNIYHACFEKK